MTRQGTFRWYVFDFCGTSLLGKNAQGLLDATSSVSACHGFLACKTYGFKSAQQLSRLIVDSLGEPGELGKFMTGNSDDQGLLPQRDNLEGLHLKQSDLAQNNLLLWLQARKGADAGASCAKPVPKQRIHR